MRLGEEIMNILFSIIINIIIPQNLVQLFQFQQRIMNEEARKIIKASFCPKEKWVSDKDVQSCFKCDKKFQTLYRRKHHCRYCGQIFCNICSDFFFEGKDLGETEKQIRMCNSCYQKCWKYIVKHDEPYILFRKSNDNKQETIPDGVEELQIEKSSSFTEEDKVEQIRKVINQYSSNQLERIKQFEDKVDQKFIVLMQVIMKQNKIPLKYLPKIHDVVLSVVKRVPPNALVTNNMNICKNIRVKSFYSDQDVSIQLRSIMLIKKNFQSKKIKQHYENVNCILVYGGLQSADLVGGEKEASFEQIVQNRTKQMGKVISYCERLGIIVIFLEGNIEKQFDDKFYNSGITVIPKIKIDHLFRLKIGLNIEKIVNSAHQLYSYTKQQIVGTIKMMTTEMEPSIKDQMKTKRFFAIKTVRDELGMLIKIKGKNPQLLSTIKMQITQMIMLLRHMRLKVHKVLMDQQLLNSMSVQTRTDCYLNNPEMFFNLYNEHHSDILNYLKERYLSYKQISFVESNYQNYPQVTKPGVQQYLQARTHSFRNKWDYFTDICGDIKEQHRRFYSEDDVPMGIYLLKKFTTLNKKCLTCARPNYHHIELFYSTDHYVKFWTESRIPDIEQSTIQICIMLEEEHQEDQLGILFRELSKNKQKFKLQCFIQCYKCQEVLSDKIQLTRQHLQYSMISFISHFFQGTIKTTIRQNNNKFSNWGKQSACSHIEKVRVIQMGDRYLKTFVGSYTLNRLCVLTQTGKKMFLHKKEVIHSLQFCLLQVNKIDQIVMFLLDQIKGIAEGSKNTRFDKMIRDPRSSFIKARNSIIGSSNLKLSQAQCIDIIMPQLIQELTKLNTVCGMLLNPKKVNKILECEKMYHIMMDFLKKIYIIIIEFKKSIKKRELDKKYEVKDFDNDFIMQEIDINQLTDSSNFSNMSQFTQTESQINKSQLVSSTQDHDRNQIIQNYDWLQPIDSTPLANRSDRKTVYNRRTTKATQEEVMTKFKQISSFMRVEPAFLQFVPCYPHKPQSLIASALNSQTHKQCLIDSVNIPAELIIKTNQIYQASIIVENDQLKKLQMIIEIQQRMFDIGNKVKKLTNSIPHQIIILYPHEFELLRRKDRIPIELFIESIAGAESWLASGGKSGSSFMRSFNDLIVIKKISIKEFLTFRKFLPEYFTHLHNGSLLVPIYGAFIVAKNSQFNYFIVMKNLFFGMKDWYLYDMKGSVARRFSKWPVIPLDINFLIDRNSEPIFCKDNILKHLSSTLDYLVKNNIVDYSLILVVEIENQKDYYMDGNRFHIGIVDYLREFGTAQKAERLWKGSDGTVQEPIEYRNRMYKNFRKYFIQIPL